MNRISCLAQKDVERALQIAMSYPTWSADSIAKRLSPKRPQSTRRRAVLKLLVDLGIRGR